MFPTKPIVLVGMMGCGKTKVGKALAKKLELPFIDLDHEIEATTGKKVSEIFEEHGESHFRKLELEILEKVLDGKPVILATGGGAFIQEQAREFIKKKGLSIWIRADFDTLLERVSKKSTRPILEKGNKAEILKDLMDKRYPIYEKADITVDTSRGASDIVVERIMERIVLSS